MADSFHSGARWVTVIATPCALALVCFGEEILFLWTGNLVLAERTSPLLALLSVGTLLNALMHIPYVLQLANGWTGLAVRMNLVAVAVLLPAILWVTPRYGPTGVAWVLVVLNAGYLFIGGYAMFRRLLPDEMWIWYLRDVALPLVAGGGVMIIMWLLHGIMTNELSRQVTMLFAIGGSVVAAGFAAESGRFPTAGAGHRTAGPKS